MSYTFLRDSEPIARKFHGCNACDHLLSGGIDQFDFLPTENEAIERAKSNGWKIQKGDKYYNQVGIYDGNFQNFKAIKEIHDICLKYNYYEYD
jgi:hypothetical protein